MNRINIINNLSGNHYQRIIDIAQSADTLYIVSPFLMESFDTIFSEFKEMGVKKIHLITTLKNKDMDLLRKANALYSFCTLCDESGIKYEICVDNKLHGKIYAATKNGIYTCGMLTSANFTESGLNHNHEWGLWIDDPRTLKNLIKEVLSVCSKPLSDESISGIINKVDDYFKTKTEPEQSKPDLSIDEFIDFGISVSDKRYFIKPEGHSESHYPETAKLDSDIATLNFSKRKPRSVRVGDILICYAVGSTKLLGYFEVLTSPVFSGNDEDRWPWSIQGKNLCPVYSENWTHHNNTLGMVKDAFTVDAPITYNGGKTLGGLNFGSDKIRLTEHFADHIIGIIERDAKNTGTTAFNMSDLDHSIIEIIEKLARHCVEHETPLFTYGDLSKQLSATISPRNLDRPLGQVSDFCKDYGMPLLSVIVINQDTFRPGDGFFKYFFPQSKRDDWDAIYIQQLDLVKAYKQWDKLADFASVCLR